MSSSDSFRAGDLPIAEPVDVEVLNFPAVQPVSDNGGSLTVDGSVSVSNFPSSQAVTGPLTDAQLRTTPVPVSGTFFQVTQPVSGTVAVSNFPATQPVSINTLPLPTGATTEATLSTLNANIAKEYGTWAYYAGVSGSVGVTAGQRVLSISCHCTTAGTVTINGGSSIPVPANVGFSVDMRGVLVAPTIVFTGTDSYFIEVVA